MKKEISLSILNIIKSSLLTGNVSPWLKHVVNLKKMGVDPLKSNIFGPILTDATIPSEHNIFEKFPLAYRVQYRIRTVAD